MAILPQFLYRGDCDKDNTRQLRTTINHGLLMTNLSRGGNGQVFQKSLVELINRHVSIGWEKTHFLSFTSDKNIAFYYGGSGYMYYQTYSDDNWDFALLTLATSKFLPDSIAQIETGVYRTSYYPVCREFLPLYTIVLIDIVSFLKEIKQTNNNLSEAIYNAERDKEWLIYPATSMRDSNEFTSKLDMGCIVEKEVYKI